MIQTYNAEHSNESTEQMKLMNPQDPNIGSGGEAAAPHPMASLREESYAMSQLSQGDIREGKITSITHNEILVDVGAKSEGLIAGRELEQIDVVAKAAAL